MQSSSIKIHSKYNQELPDIDKSKISLPPEFPPKIFSRQLQIKDDRWKYEILLTENVGKRIFACAELIEIESFVSLLKMPPSIVCLSLCESTYTNIYMPPLAEACRRSRFSNNFFMFPLILLLFVRAITLL